MDYSSRQRFDEISKLRFDGNLAGAIELCQNAIHNFASMDAMIAATAKLAQNNCRDITVVTSDKGLKACLSKIGIPCNDIFAAS